MKAGNPAGERQGRHARGWQQPGARDENLCPSVTEGYFDLDPETQPNPRWASEASFFDRIAEDVGETLRPIDPAVVERYQRARRSWCNKERRFQLLGDLRGKRVLDVGCGEGTNAVLMAKLGADVTGVDISPGSIAVSERRARLDGVAARTRFLCAPLETVALADHAFDVIWGDGVLHHLIPVLGDVMGRLLQWAAPGALFLFSEPVSVSRLMRRMRAGMPIHTDATPDERPLREAELEIVERALPGLRKEWFGVFARFGRYVVRQNDFEHSRRSSRWTMDALWLADRAVLSVPGLARLGSTCILRGRAPVS